MRLFPLPCTPWVGRMLGKGTSKLFPRERRIATAQLDYVREHLRTHGVPAADGVPDSFPPVSIEQLNDVESLTTRVFGHVGEFMGETFILDRLLERDEKAANGYRFIASTGQDMMVNYTSQGYAVLALSAHIGCFELLAAFHAAHGIDLVVIGRDPNYSVVSSALRDLRSSYGVDTIWRDESSGGRKLLSAVRTPGKLVGALIDQDTDVENLFSPFFGLAAAYPIGPITLAIKKKLPIVSTFIVRTGKQQHHVITRDIPYSADDPEAPAKILFTYNLHLEDLILRFPEQWIWWHRRWRRRPDVNYASGNEAPRSASAYCDWISTQERRAAA